MLDGFDVRFYCFRFSKKKKSLVDLESFLKNIKVCLLSAKAPQKS